MAWLPLPATALAALPGEPSAAASVAPTGTETFTDALVGLFLLFVAAKAGEEVFRRLRLPGVIGELVGGFLVGPFALGLVSIGTSATVFAELGVIILLFVVGLEVGVEELLQVGRLAIAVGVIGFILPIVAGTSLGLLVGSETMSALLIGLALAATSIGITSRVLAELGVLDRAFSRVILGAAVVDDILALLAIGVLSGLAEGDLSLGTIAVLGAGILFVLGGLAIAPLARRVSRDVFVWPVFADTPIVPVFIVMFAGALLASVVGLAAIIGAFVVGLIIAESPVRDEVEHEFRPLVAIFTPFFFAVTGASLDLRLLANPTVAVLALTLAVVGVVTKMLGGILGARSEGRWASITIGFGMVPRGEVGIVVANLALTSGVVSADIFAAMLVAVIATTIVAPYLLAWSVPRTEAEAAAGGGPGPTPQPA
jgi:Kef-type K+ transport system membrane component KefB